MLLILMRYFSWPPLLRLAGYQPSLYKLFDRLLLLNE